MKLKYTGQNYAIFIKKTKRRIDLINDLIIDFKEEEKEEVERLSKNPNFRGKFIKIKKEALVSAGE